MRLGITQPHSFSALHIAGPPRDRRLAPMCLQDMQWCSNDVNADYAQASVYQLAHPRSATCMFSQCGPTHTSEQRSLTLLLACSPHIGVTCKAWAKTKGQIWPGCIGSRLPHMAGVWCMRHADMGCCRMCTAWTTTAIRVAGAMHMQAQWLEACHSTLCAGGKQPRMCSSATCDCLTWQWRHCRPTVGITMQRYIVTCCHTAPMAHLLRACTLLVELSLQRSRLVDAAGWFARVDRCCPMSAIAAILALASEISCCTCSSVDMSCSRWTELIGTCKGCHAVVMQETHAQPWHTLHWPAQVHTHSRPASMQICC